MDWTNTQDYLCKENYLCLEIAYSNLHNAYLFGDRQAMINAYIKAGNVYIPSFNEKVLSETKQILLSNGVIPHKETSQIQDLQEADVRLNVQGCLNALQKEMAQFHFYASNYMYAQQTLFRPYHIFNNEEVLYEHQGQQLKVSDFLAVSKYATSIAEAIDPDNEEYAKASAVITTLQGIDAILNNKPEDKPVNKMLHLANSFISSVVKSSLTNRDEKREVTVTATMIDLVIDFFCAK